MRSPKKTATTSKGDHDDANEDQNHQVISSKKRKEKKKKKKEKERETNKQQQTKTSKNAKTNSAT